MHIAQPSWIFGACLVVPLLLWSYRRLDRLHSAALTAFAAPRLVRQLTRSMSRQRVWLKRVAMIAAAVFIFGALARPQGGFTTEVHHDKGLDILVAIDTSKSMLTQDVKPNRLARAKLAALDLLDRLHGDAVGLLAFAGNAFLQCPITTDYDAFRDSVEALDTNTIPRGGTDIAAAIHAAQATFATRPGSNKILILMTDGEDLGEQGVAAARAAGVQGVRIFTVGVGSAAGDLIPVVDDSGATRFVQDAGGQYVKSRLDVATLTKIAQVAGGLYQPLGNQGQGLIGIYSALGSFARHELTPREFRVYTQLYQWPLGASIVLLLAESLLLTRRKTAQSSSGGPPRSASARTSLSKPLSALVGLMALALGLSILPPAARASAGQAESAYRHGDYALATKEYAASARKSPSQTRLQFNLGSAAYKAGDLNAATSAFQHALKNADPPLQQSTYYNLGNTEYRVGQHVQQSQPQQTVAYWQSALKSYDAALEIRPGDADAKFNRSVVSRNLAQLQKEQQQKKDQQRDQGKKDRPDPSKQNQEQQQQQQKGGKPEGTGGPPEAKNAGQNGKPAPGAQQGTNGGTSQGGGARPSSTPNPGSAQAEGNPQNTAQSDATNETAKTGGPGKIEPAGGSAGAAANASQPTGRPAKAAPGEMTGEQAAQLLDSLKNDQRRLVAAAPSTNSQATPDNPPTKDW